MKKLPGFLEKWVEDSARGRVTREISPIQSEWPAHTGSALASGFCIPNSGSCSLLMSVPSSRWFKPRTLWAHNRANAITELLFYAAGSAADASATIQGLWVGPRETAFIALDGITVGQDVWAMNVSGASVLIRMGGILLASGPEN